MPIHPRVCRDALPHIWQLRGDPAANQGYGVCTRCSVKLDPNLHQSRDDLLVQACRTCGIVHTFRIGDPFPAEVRECCKLSGRPAEIAPPPRQEDRPLTVAGANDPPPAPGRIVQP